jgi:hypothetical protein
LGYFAVLPAVFAIVSLAACDKPIDWPAAKGSGAVAAGGQAAVAPAAGSQVTAPAAVAGGQAVTPDPAAGLAAAAGSPAPPASASSVALFKVGDKVDGQWTNGRWYPGKIGAANSDGTFRVNYNDGDVSPSLPSAKIRVHHATATHHGSVANACRGGLMQCGGRCVDIHNDNHNCNACGRQCPEACMGGSCVSNHYKYGN